MLPEVGGFELVVIAAVALIVVGPKDLPVMMRKVGKFLARMRGMAAEFRSSFDEMARQSELDELRREVEALRTGKYTHDVATDIDASFNTLDDEFRADPSAQPASFQTPPTEPTRPVPAAPPQRGLMPGDPEPLHEVRA